VRPTASRSRQHWSSGRRVHEHISLATSPIPMCW